jgi:tetratricopeptide (TPR) repeat protein
MNKTFAAFAVGAIVCAASARADDAFDAALVALAKSWDHAQFEITEKHAQIAEFERIEAAAQALEQRYPDRAEPIAWEAMSLSSEAGVVRGRTALGEVNRARKLLERAEDISPNALGDGSVYTSLGVIYSQVPGFPIAFGSKDKARRYLLRALAVNPTGVEPNYFMAEFLVHEHQYAQAIAFLNRALAAPDRPGREAGDRGRRRDAQALLAEAQSRLR